MNKLVINNREILTSSSGFGELYLLNEIHRASGSDPNHRPSNWLRLKQTQDQIQYLTDAQICASPIKIVKGGLDGQGTFAHELLVISYASWISAEFHIKVNQAFMDMHRPKIQLPDFTNPIEAARAWADQYEAKEIAQQALIEAKPKIDYFERVSLNTTNLNATQVGKKVGMSATALNKHLDDLGVYNKSVKRSRVFKQWFIDEGFGEVKTTDNGYTQSVFTIKGEQKVIELLTSEGII